MQLNQEVIVVFIIVSLAMAGIFILSMYFQAFMKNKTVKNLK
jgi:type II secretory pathway pseudopilin PulG